MKASTRMKVFKAQAAYNARVEANTQGAFKKILKVSGAAVGGGVIGAAVAKGIQYVINNK
jgi:hypothetical protein